MNETTSWTDHVLAAASWRRFGFMLLFAPLLGCVGFMIACIALFQFFSVLASGENNPQLRNLGRDLSRFGVGIMDYLTYNSERKPFPFNGHAPTEASEKSAGEAEPLGEEGAPPVAEPGHPARRATVGRRKRTTTRTTTRRRSSTPGRKRNSPPPEPEPEPDRPPTETDGEEGDRPE